MTVTGQPDVGQLARQSQVLLTSVEPGYEPEIIVATWLPLLPA
ncbi:MAG TPA: hypothetical protein VGG54_10200 [Trebonia sp.]